MPDEKRVIALLLVAVEASGLAKTWKPQGNGRPPLVWKGPLGWNTGPPYLLHSALPLWWNDELVGMGWDIARRFFLENTEPHQRRSDQDLEVILDKQWPSLQECRLLAEQLRNLGHVSRVISLFHDDVDGLVEIA
jgi:hypothetical protein